ncbi:MAG: flagellar hook-associated protein FlgK [bacterium]
MAGFMAMDNGLSGLLTSRRALDVVSQNVSNASNENYTRQRAEITANRPLILGNLSVGTGSSVDEITRARDDLLDSRLRQEKQTKGRFDQLQEVYRQIENALNEPSDQGIRGTLSSLVSSMQNLANQPENLGSRRDVVGQATTLANVMKRFQSQLRSIAGGPHSSAASQIESTVGNINNIGEQIASLNKEINTAQASGATPNDLLDKRLELVNELSEYIDTTVDKSSSSYRVNVSGYTLVQDGQSHQLSFGTRPGEEDEGKKILYDDSLKSEIRPRSGRLKALTELREEKVPKLIDQLNDMAVQFVDRFNDIHRSGFGRQGQTRNNFWQELPSAEEDIYRLEGLGDLGGDSATRRAGFIDSPDLKLTGDNSTAQPENFEGDAGVINSPEGTLEINGSTINYDMSEDSIKNIIERINEDNNNASAYLSAENRLVIKGTQENDYQLDQIKDTGLLLDKTNIMTVGGADQSSMNDVDPGNTIVNEFSGNNRIDDFSASGADLAQGTLEFESSDSDGFSINYDARNDSLEDIVTRINEGADSAGSDGSNVSAEVTPDNKLRLYASDESPDPALDPGTSVSSDASFKVNETSSQQLNANVGAGNDVNIEVNDVSKFNEGEEIIISDNNNSNSETATITDIDSAAGTIEVDNLANGYNADNSAVRRVEGENNKRNFLNVMGMNRQYDSGQERTEYSFTGRSKRPPVADQVANLKVNERIDDNPDLIAAGSGKDTDLDGVPDAPNGPGDGDNMYELSNLPKENIMETGNTSFDGYLSSMVSEIGNEASLINREQEAAKNLVNQINDRVRSNSGVSLDEEMTKMLRFQQGYQASARVISTVRQMSNELFGLV